MGNQTSKNLLLIATGGTIASLEGNEGLAPGLKTSELEAYVKKKNLPCSVDSLDLLNIDSTNMQPEHWVTICETIANHYDQYDGFVITHGTDTMAFSGAALSYMFGDLGKPVVLTGSQVPFAYKKTDAKRNLVDAVRFALEDRSGVFIVFDGRVIAGTRAVKIRTKSFDAFESINYPYIAKMKATGVHYNVDSPARSDNPLQINTNLDTNVFLLRLYPGIQPEVFDHVRDSFKGVIIESFGNGGIPFRVLPKIEELIEAGTAVVVTTQCLQEGEDLSLYEVGRKVAENPKVIISKDMNTEALIPKLMWALGQSEDVMTVKQLIETPMAFDCSF